VLRLNPGSRKITLCFGICILLLACTAIYFTPKTASLGAILLADYLGGAAAIQVIARLIFSWAMGTQWSSSLVERSEA